MASVSVPWWPQPTPKVSDQILQVDYGGFETGTFIFLFSSLMLINSNHHHHHCLVFDILLFLSEVLHRHQTYSVDCSRANNGLFCGIFVTVVTIVTIVVFFVLIASDNPALRQTAITLGSVTELALYSFSTTAVLIGIVQVRLTST